MCAFPLIQIVCSSFIWKKENEKRRNLIDQQWRISCATKAKPIWTTLGSHPWSTQREISSVGDKEWWCAACLPRFECSPAFSCFNYSKASFLNFDSLSWVFLAAISQSFWSRGDTSVLLYVEKTSSSCDAIVVVLTQNRNEGKYYQQHENNHLDLIACQVKSRPAWRWILRTRYSLRDCVFRKICSIRLV